jgi:hypothetical protein
MKKHKILLGLTTNPDFDWKNKIKEIGKYNIQELALFPTYLNINERKSLYNLLKKTSLKEIPHVHLRSDMEEWELDFLIKRFKTRVFNIHSAKNQLQDFSILLKKIPKYHGIIYLENGYDIDEIFDNFLSQVGGLCVDFSHLHSFIYLQKIPGYKRLFRLMKQNKVGCCHISAVTSKKIRLRSESGKEIETNDSHYLQNLKELDYIKEYIDSIPYYVSIELENDFETQLKVKKYLEKLLN